MANTASSPFRPLPKPISTLRLDYPKGTSPPASPVRGVFQRTPEFDALLARVLRPGGAHGAVCKTVLTHDSTGKKEEVALKVLPLRDQVRRLRSKCYLLIGRAGRYSTGTRRLACAPPRARGPAVRKPYAARSYCARFAVDEARSSPGVPRPEPGRG